MYNEVGISESQIIEKRGSETKRGRMDHSI